MIPRSTSEEMTDGDTEGTDGPSQDEKRLDFDNMAKAIPKGASQRQKIKTRDWKSSVAVYNDL